MQKGIKRKAPRNGPAQLRRWQPSQHPSDCLHRAVSTAIFKVNGRDGGLILYFLSNTQHLGHLIYFSTVDLLSLIKSFIAPKIFKIIY